MSVAVSCVIPVYNAKRFIAAMLDSLLKQTFVDWEAICIDDGSTDGSGAILDFYATNDARIKVFHQSNGGMARARNVGINKTSGMWITFADSDDVLHPSYFENAMILASKAKAKAVRMRFQTWEEGALPPNVTGANDQFEVIKGREMVLRWTWSQMCAHGCFVWLLFLSRELVNEWGKEPFPIDVEFGEDIVFCSKCTTNCDCVVQGEFAGYLYQLRKTCSVTTTSYSSMSVVRFLSAWKDACDRALISADKLTCQMIKQEFTQKCWLVLYNWCVRHKDLTAADEIHILIWKFVKENLLCLSDLKLWARVPFGIYLLTGCRGIIVIAIRVAKLAKNCKHCFNPWG